MGQVIYLKQAGAVAGPGEGLKGAALAAACALGSRDMLAMGSKPPRPRLFPLLH